MRLVPEVVVAIATQNAHGAVRFSMACILQGEAPLDKAPCDSVGQKGELAGGARKRWRRPMVQKRR